MSLDRVVFFRCFFSFLMSLPVVLGCLTPAIAMRTEFTPFVYVNEDYSDNYNQTSTDREEEFYTTYGTGFTFSMKDKTKKVSLTYSPEFVDHKNFNEEDTLEHNAYLTGDLELSKKSGVNFNLSYDGRGDRENKKYETWENSASLDGYYEFTRYTGMTFSQNYSNSFDRVQRTGEWKENKTNTTSVGLNNQFGRDNSLEFKYSYAVGNFADPDQDEYEKHNYRNYTFDNYTTGDPDEYKKHTPSASLSFWFTPMMGFDSNLSYEQMTYELSDKNSDTYNGDLRLIKKLTRQFEVFLKYEHTHTKEEPQDHTVYHPSVGFDWEITEDSGLSLGTGYLFHKWENQDDDGSIFFDVDAYKHWDFSQRGSLALTAASGYDASDEDAASLGFHVYYQAGSFLSYQLARRLSTSFTGSYTIDQYDDPDVARVDNTLDLAATLTWTLLKSLSLNASYWFVDFTTDAEPSLDYQENTIGAGFSWRPLNWITVRLNYSYSDYNAENDDDYYENKGTLMVHLSPARPARLETSQTREEIENRIYHKDKLPVQFKGLGNDL